jgi:hypothetical protein
MTENQPNPGSPQAVDKGCKCPVMDNGNGKGIGPLKDGTMMFWRALDCPLHGKGDIK